MISLAQRDDKLWELQSKEEDIVRFRPFARLSNINTVRISSYIGINLALSTRRIARETRMVAQNAYHHGKLANKTLNRNKNYLNNLLSLVQYLMVSFFLF